MPKATVEDVAALLVKAGATDEQAEHLIAMLGGAGLSAAQMRAWLASPSRGYSVQVDTATIGAVTAPWKLVPSWAIEDDADAIPMCRCAMLRSLIPPSSAGAPCTTR